ncbi:Rid family detoxifying hydrolase [Marinomonas sp. C2222]|uniref:Rid family detoxifying hydrolase n=1 Tax=Marinomonas sargassi TaxID=2984494 RepID=A0ABT2YRF4_9GAMM|nr:Rid family detoxifying hydrolase [Marinomonas sargassi]MCV2402474.1 Rid family detoxifying hydrolase [Marinomonas sargassi]
MINKTYISTHRAPEAIWPSSQALRMDGVVFISGQSGIDPYTMQINYTSIEAQTIQALENFKAIVEATNGSLLDVVKLNVYVTDMFNLPIVNQVMSLYFSPPYPPRTVLSVKELSNNAGIEIDGFLLLSNRFSLEELGVT